MSIGDEQYVSITTFTSDLRPKPTPVWIADLGDGRIGFTTAAGSWKVKRMRKTPEVVVQASDMRGRAKGGSRPIEATAEVVTGAEFETVREAVAHKYGWQYSMIGLRDRIKTLLGREVPPDCGVVITPKDADERAD
jgi:PPOX class probable F420-dependent enzyme